MMIARFDRLEDKVDGITEEVAAMKNKYTEDETRVKTTTRLIVWLGGAVITAINIALNVFFR